jgi:hypothetical protein
MKIINILKPLEMLRIPDTHLNFSLSKKHLDDETVNYPNSRHICCKFCNAILIPEGLAVKVFRNVSGAHTLSLLHN